MTQFHTWRLLALADEFEEKMDDKTIGSPLSGDKPDYNKQFHAQREMLSKFHDFFQRQLRMVLGQMESDLRTLKERSFDAKMHGLLAKLYGQLQNIFNRISEEKPYLAAQELVDYVTDRHQRAVIDNLEFLGQHHLEATKPQTVVPLPPNVKQITTVRSLAMLTNLAEKLAQHMQQHPLLAVPTPTPLPPPRMTPATEHPVQPAGEGEVTNPAIPFRGNTTRIIS